MPQADLHGLCGAWQSKQQDDFTMNIPAEDCLAIQELLQRYALDVDTSQLDRLMALFIEDLMFDETRIGGAVAHGEAELSQTYRSAFEQFHMAHHGSSGIVDEFGGDRARGCYTYQAVVRVKATGAPWQIEACYQDEYRKQDGRWLFQSRVVVPLIPPAPLEGISATWAHTAS